MRYHFLTLKCMGWGAVELLVEIFFPKKFSLPFSYLFLEKFLDKMQNEDLSFENFGKGKILRYFSGFSTLKSEIVLHLKVDIIKRKIS